MRGDSGVDVPPASGLVVQLQFTKSPPYTGQTALSSVTERGEQKYSSMCLGSNDSLFPAPILVALRSPWRDTLHMTWFCLGGMES